MKVAALAMSTAVFLTPAFADAEKVWRGQPSSNYEPSIARLHEPTAPDAVASLTFQNEPVHWQDEAFSLDWGGFVVLVEFDWQADHTQAERLTVYPPDGYIAIPPQITVNEDETQTLHFYAWEGM